MSAKRSSRPTQKIGEDDLLGRIRNALPLPRRVRAHLRLAIGDDAAIFRARPGFETILTCDWFLQGTHFLLDRHPPDSVGWKCLARAVSDVAAMGAEPRCFLLSLALPASQGGEWLKGFLNGLRAASRKLNCPAAGGDTTRRDQVLINVTVVGECRQGQAVLRSGAKPSDAIFLSGRLGEAEYGLRLIQSSKHRRNARDSRLRKHLYPQPRLALGAWLAAQGLATAMMDLSDGLSTDLPRLCRASGAGARIEATRIPRVRISQRGPDRRDAISLALHGGDDYELLFTVAPNNVRKIPRRIAGVPITLIGHVTRQRGVSLISSNNEESRLTSSGWDPFRN
jgi:thiamine-monophosphate kinase